MNRQYLRPRNVFSSNPHDDPTRHAADLDAAGQAVDDSAVDANYALHVIRDKFRPGDRRFEQGRIRARRLSFRRPGNRSTAMDVEDRIRPRCDIESRGCRHEVDEPVRIILLKSHGPAHGLSRLRCPPLPPGRSDSRRVAPKCPLGPLEYSDKLAVALFVIPSRVMKESPAVLLTTSGPSVEVGQMMLPFRSRRSADFSTGTVMIGYPPLRRCQIRYAPPDVAYVRPGEVAEMCDPLASSSGGHRRRWML